VAKPGLAVARWAGCFVLATVTWLASLHLWFSRDPADLRARLAARQIALWEPSGSAALTAATESLRARNPEWDLMGRMFTVLALANLIEREPARADSYLHTIDTIIDRTEQDAEASGPYHFLLPYGRERPFVYKLQRSLFVDGELAMMLAVRQLVRFDPARRYRTGIWVERAIAQIEAAPALFGESYPDEVWVFCNAVALAAIRIHDETEGAPQRHRPLFDRWIASARKHIVDASTGILASKVGYDGSVREGPEGSTIWLVSAMLRVVDDGFARDQYTRARAALGRTFAGFGWAREWPAGHTAREDIDSGPTVPVVGANAGSSGLALVAAAAFGDRELLNGLVTSLAFAGFPIDGGARFAAGNHCADAVILYALSSGPLWRRLGVQGGLQ
jgi:hypothetical protein